MFDFILNKNKCIVDDCSTQNENLLEEMEQKLQPCDICAEDILAEEFIKLKNCEHKLCQECFKKLNESDPKCPFCLRWFDKPIGSQPKNGEMTHKILRENLPGFPNRNTIEITYCFPSGIQQSNHPNPGR